MWADTVINQLKGLNNPDLTIAIQSDIAGPGGMTQYWLKDHEVNIERITSDYSDSRESLEIFLNNILETGRFDKIALIFLDHGGRLDEVGLDEFTDGPPSFLNLHDIKTTVAAFNQKRGRPLELLYFQVCTKSNVEVLFETRDLSHFTLASQNELGAPNYYYQGLSELKPSADGAWLAKLIVDNERSDMYYSETLVDNKQWDGLINAGKEPPRENPKPELLKPLRYYESTYLDLVSFYHASGYSEKQLDLFKEQLNHLIIWHKINPKNSMMKGFSGISVLSPWDRDYARHQSRFELYSHWNITKMARDMR